MPIFEYACPVCGFVFEKFVMNRNQEAPACPQCGSNRAEQKFSTFATASAGPRASRGACAPAGGT